jgi:hypothetical protein
MPNAQQSFSGVAISSALPPAASEPLPPSMAYILSASHSGSTLLAMLLGAQPRAYTVGELRAPSLADTDAYCCSCGEKIKQCPFWARVTQAMERKGIRGFDITNASTSIYKAPSRYARRLLAPMARGPLLEGARDLALGLSPAWPGHLEEVQRRNLALVEVLQELAGAEIIIDSSKSVLHLKYLLKNPRLDIKIIWLVRDGRGVATSLIRHGLKRATPAETMAEAAREWRRSNESAECLLRRLPSSQWIRVQYEDLCRSAETTLGGICQFLGLDSKSVSLDFRSRQQHVLGNEMRLKSTTEIQLDERWRKQLTQDDLEVFEKVAGRMNRQYGYA